METFSKIKSNYVALGFTISIHMLLFFILLITVFLKPHQVESSVLNPSITYMSLDGFESMVSEQTTKKSNISSPKSSSVISTDFKENDVRLNTVKRSTSTEIAEDAGNNELNNALAKIHERNSKKGINGNSEGVGTNNVGNSKTGKNSHELKTGDTFILTGRFLISKPGSILNSAEEGKVIVEIIVDENGNVIKATPGQRGSTTTSANLYTCAARAAFQTKFNSSPEGIKEQRGTYTFVFTLE